MSAPIEQAMTQPEGHDFAGSYDTPRPDKDGRRQERLFISRFSIYSMVPPLPPAAAILPRADDVGTILRMLREPHTNGVVLSGEPGAGKSTLAALVYSALESASVREAASPAAGGVGAPNSLRQGALAGRGHRIWLSLGINATVPDVIAAILNGMHAETDDFYFLTPEQQIAVLVQALRRPEESAFIVLDQFEELLNPALAETSAPPTPTGLAGRGAISLFFEMLREADIGRSRVLLTSYRSPNSARNGEETRIRSYLVSRMSIPEGVALLQQGGVQGAHSELSLVWQRCGGHVFALVLFSRLIRLSGFSLSYVLNSPEYAAMWNGEVTQNLVRTLSYFLNPIQRTLMRALCLFAEPVPLDAIATAIVGQEGGVIGEEGAIHSAPTQQEEFNGSPFVTFQHELSALVEMCLVSEQSRGIGQHTYYLHPLLRQYTREHYLEGNQHQVPGYGQARAFPSDVLGVAAPPDSMGHHPEAWQIALAAGHMRVALYYARQAQEYCPPRNARTSLAHVEPLLAMIRHLCLGWHWQEAYNVLCAEELHEALLRWGALNTLIGLYIGMLPPLGVLNRSDLAEVCNRLGVLSTRLGEKSTAHAYYEQALAVFRELGEGYGEAMALANQGELFRSMGEWETARTYFQRALLLNAQYGNEQLQSVLLHNLGLLYQATKDYATALRCYVESLKIAHRLQGQDLSSLYNEGMILTNMGFLLYEQGHLPEAIALLCYAVQVRQSFHDPAASIVRDFLRALEQKMGPEAFARIRASSAGRNSASPAYNLGTHDLISRLLG